MFHNKGIDDTVNGPTTLEGTNLIKANTEQKIVEIHGIRFGGQQGQLPTVIIPSLFNPKMKEVVDHRTGSFDKEKVKLHLRRVDRISRETGNPYTVDIMATTPDAMIKYIEFVSREMNEAPFLFDAIDPKTRLAAISYLNSVGLQGRAIWNSVSLMTTEDEFRVISENRVKNIILQAFDRKDPSPKGSLTTLTRGGLLDRVRKAGVENILIDVAVLDVPSMGASSEAISLIRSEIGLPAGCAPANATYAWKAKRTDLLGSNFGSCHGAACAIMQYSGANYLIIGPIRGAKRVFKVCAMTDAMIAYTAMSKGIKPLIKTHPIYKIL
jgi:tetrahydromethanopterin S-methyltransferase subunit H